MARKTRKISKKSKAIDSIPELRRSFEYIEAYVDNKIKSNEAKEKIVKSLKKEWKKTFFKELDKKSANAFVSDRMKHKTFRKMRGGSAIAGAPLDYTTRPGVYLEQGQIPVDGKIPTEGIIGGFGSYIPYVDKGFWNPVIGQTLDPIQGQQRFPTSTPMGMGDNTFKGGKHKKKHRTPRCKGGGIIQNTGSFLSEAYNRPFIASSPPGVGQDFQDIWHGKQVGPSPDQAQRQVQYHTI